MKRREMIKSTILGAAALYTGIGRAQSPVVLKLGHDSPTTSAWHVGATRFAELVGERSNGAIEIRVYPSAQLGDLRELAELTKLGTVDMTLLTAGVAASFVPSMNMFGLPFLFSDSEQARALYQGPLGEKLMRDAEPAGYKGLGFNIRTFRSPMTKDHVIKTVSDLDGVKIRLQQVPIMIDSYRALGASPVAMPYSEVYAAAQSGVIDAVENTASGVYTPKFHEVMSYYSLLPVFINTCVLYMNGGKWKALSPDQQSLISSAAAEANEVISKTIADKDAEALAKMKDYGIKTYEGPFDLASFRKAVEPVYQKYVPELPESARGVVAELRGSW